MQSTHTDQPVKFNLRDESRSRIRTSTTKTGYVMKAVHYNGPRGGRYRPNIHFVGVTELDALRAVRQYMGRAWKPCIRQVELFEVDHLGNVRDVTSYDDLLVLVA